MILSKQMAMIRALLVDDEPRARESLKVILERYFPEVDVVGEAEGVDDAFMAIQNLKPNTVFLDINMPDGSGFDLLKRFETIDFKVVFVTAFEEYALEAIKFSALDYILKPINTNELRVAIERLTSSLDEKDDLAIKLKAFFANMEAASQEKKKIVLKTSESIHLVPIQTIVRCEADGNYTKVFFDNQPKLLISKPLKHFEDMLEEFGFVRVHQSHLVNINHVVRVDKVDGGVLIFADGAQVSISVRKREQLFKLLNSL
jgi:two-component system LytT family response regulator